MKRNNIFLILSILLMSAISCDTVDFGDTNENTNGPQTFDSAALLTATQRRYVTVGGRSFLGNPNLYVQYRSQPSYSDPSRYAEQPVNWEALYVQTLSNLEQIISLSQDEDVIQDPAYTSNGSVNNQMGAARIMKVVIFKKLTDTYGDIPYFDALNTETQAPTYTPQEEIYADFVVELQEARDMMSESELGPQGDIYFGGDVASWKMFANSLLLSVAIQMSDAAPSLAQTTFSEALNNSSGVFESPNGGAWYQPINLSSLSNPWTAFRPADYNLSEYLVNALQGDGIDFSSETEDARLSIYANQEGEGLPYGLSNYEGIGSSVKISLYLTSPNSPFPILTSSYTYLNRAEAANLGWTNEDAEEMLESGITTSFAEVTSYWGTGEHTETQGLTPIDITDEADDFAAARLADATEVGLDQVIGEEKWSALFSQGFQSWAEYRRTGFPMLTPSPEPLNNGPIPTRYLYPTSEINLNNSNWSAAVSNLSPAEDRNTSRIWWDVE